MPAERDAVTLIVGGREHRDWTSYELDSDLLTPADAWRVALGIPADAVPQLGRPWAAVTMAVIVVFFPAFVLLSQGFALVPRAALEVVEVYGGSRLKRLLIVSIPYSTPYLFAAAKLVAPRALLGVMVAEWLLTGTGLGNLLDFSRAQLDYGLVWSGAAASVIVAVLAYQIISLLERFALR